MKANKSENVSLLKKLITGLDSAGDSSLYMTSNRELAFFKCTGLKEYTGERVVLNAVDCILEITGNELELKTFSTSEICVSGEIFALRFIAPENEVGTNE